MITTISEYDFEMSSYTHGLDHTQRVMLLVQHLGKVGRLNQTLILQAYCAAAIHDMARTHDGYCDMHGEWAVEKKLPIWKHRFMEEGLTSDQLDAVAFAVHWHCKDSRNVPESSHRHVLHLLQDADALDRVRFGSAEAIDLSYLHFPFTENQIPYAEKLFYNF